MKSRTLHGEPYGHMKEFYARSLGLLRGATFPSRGGWSKNTHDTMNATREQVLGWFTRLDHSQEGIQKQ